MAEVALSGVTKSWGATPAVDRVSFSAPPGQLVVLLGPSGCGKSTTLRLIAGLETRERRHASRSAAATSPGLPPAQRGISMVFQTYALFPHLSRRREHRLRAQGAQRAAAPSATRASSASPTCSAWTQLLERKPSQLSGGQQQRVALGRAIIAETPVCLMDEPLSNLDAQLRARDAARDPRAAAARSASPWSTSRTTRSRR